MTLAWRSLMFVPADAEGRIAKAHTRGADAIILDLEDAVPIEGKAAARQGLVAAAATLAGQGQDVLVRINAAWRLAHADLEVAVNPDVRAIVAPKVEDAGALSVLSAMIGEWEAEQGLPVGKISLIALIESPLALSRLNEIAAVERVAGLALGSEDFSAVLGAPPSPQSLDLPCRMIALVAAARGQMALGTPISLAAFREADAYAEAARLGRAVGMTGALCIHPDQVAPLNAAFSPSEAELAAARKITAAWAGRPPGAAVLSLDGKMIDPPVVLQAERTLAAARS